MSTDQRSSILQRLLNRDLTLWPVGSVAATRLGWLDAPTWSTARAADLTAWADAQPESRVVLLGMGGSSLGPLVLAGTDGRGAPFVRGSRTLEVLDTTHPDSIATCSLEGALVLVSSKSGSTRETDSLLRWALAEVSPSQIVVITDAGSPLAIEADTIGVRRTFENPADIGGRYSFFSAFGMVPAALIGYDVAALCAAAGEANLDEAVETGLAWARAAKAGHPAIAIPIDARSPRFGLWVEQLIAESTGKDGTGLVPVPIADPTLLPSATVLRRTFDDALDLAAACFELEVAVAVCGSALELDPFNEPDVASAKARTTARLSGEVTNPVPELAVDEVDAWLAREAAQATYVSVQAYLPLDAEADLDRLRDLLQGRLAPVPVTAGFGPRFLHSTGQLHKGGPAGFVALQILDTPTVDVAIPGEPASFATVIEAQANGDYDALSDRGRRVARVRVRELAELVDALGQA